MVPKNIEQEGGFLTVPSLLTPTKKKWWFSSIKLGMHLRLRESANYGLVGGTCQILARPLRTALHVEMLM